MEEKQPKVLSSQLFQDRSLVEVVLNCSVLTWGSAGHHAVHVCEMVGVQDSSADQTNKLSNGRERKEYAKQHLQPHPHTFTVSYVRRTRHRRWLCCDITFGCTNQGLCQQWIQAINDQLSLLSDRPQSLLVYINPHSGKKIGKWTYKRKVAPLFHRASISADVIVTERANHARDHLRAEANLEKYDGVVCVGGDGMFSEILHGLVSRTQSDHGVDQNQPDAHLVPCSLRIGIIPAGSTDCVCYATVGTNDPVTSTLHIIVGDSQPMDVCSVHNNNNNNNNAFLRYSVSLLGYGFYGDVLADSERKRWMGPLRYDLAGVKTFLSHNCYEGTVSFVPAEGSQEHPRDHLQCGAGCHVCHHGPNPNDRRKRSTEDENTLGKGGEGGWRVVRGKFIAINAASMSCACPRSPQGLSPSAHLADGTADLILVRKCSRFDFFRHLLRHTNKEDQFDHSFVEVHRVLRFRFQPKHPEVISTEDLSESGRKGNGKKTKACGAVCSSPPGCDLATARSHWTCDGEILPHAAVQVSVQCQLIRLFARGIENQ